MAESLYFSEQTLMPPKQRKASASDVHRLLIPFMMILAVQCSMMQ